MKNKLRRALYVALCSLFVVLPPTAAYAHLAQYDYASGRGGVGGTFPGSNAFNHRDYNQVWHEPGYFWQVYYLDTDGFAYGYVRNSTNPTKWPNEIGYATPKCHNENDNSLALWTCQSTGG